MSDDGGLEEIKRLLGNAESLMAWATAEYEDTTTQSCWQIGRGELLAAVERYGAQRELEALNLFGCTRKDLSADLLKAETLRRGPLGRCVHYGGKRICRKAMRERLKRRAGGEAED